MADEKRTLLRVKDVAQQLAVDPETVRRWLRSGKLPGFQLTQQSGWRIRQEDVDRLIEDLEGKPAA